MTARFDRNGYFERAHSATDSAWPELPPLPDPTPSWWERRRPQLVIVVLSVAVIFIYILWAARLIFSP